jgi:glucose-1-phosphate adenylyltransferase
MHKVRGALLAGGRGERMGPLTRRLCKPLLPYAGVCRLVDFTMANVVRSGVAETVVLSAPGARDLIEHLLDKWDGHAGTRLHLGPHDDLVRGHRASAEMPLGERPPERGTADALLTNADRIFAAGAEDLLLLHADHVYVFDYGPMLREHRASKSDVTIGVQRIERRFVSLFGMVETADDGTVRRLVEKPAHATSDLVFTAFCLFRLPALKEALSGLSALPDQAWQHDVSRDVIPAMIADGRRVRTFPVESYWADIGTVERYLLGHLQLVDRPGLLPFVDAPRTLPGAETMRVYGQRVLAAMAPQPGVRVRNSVLYPGCVVEPGAEVESSVLLPGSRVCAGAVVRDTIVLEEQHVTDVRVGVDELG